MRVRCKYCKTVFDTKDKYCPYCYARVRDNDSVTMTDGRARAVMFRHADNHQELNSRYLRETGKEAKPCSANKVDTRYRNTASRPNNNGGHTSANTDRYVRTSSQNRSANRKNGRKNTTISQIIAWVVIIYVLIQVFVVAFSFLLF